MKTLGILGGVGPETTSKIYLSVIRHIRKNGGEKYPPIMIYNLPFPFAIENEVIAQGINSEKMIPYLVSGAKILEKSGVDFGILPCNTLHKYIGEIRSAVKFPFLSIVEETVLTLKNMKVKSAGILATQTTIDSRIYEVGLRNSGIDLIYPSCDEQATINNIIINLLKGTKSESQKEKIETVCSSLHKRGADVILLACTDLQLITSNMQVEAPIVDTTEILMLASVHEMTKF